MVNAIKAVNAAIDSPHFELGVSYFLRETLEQDIEDIWRSEIEPYLEDAFFDQEVKMAAFRWEKIRAALGL